MRAIDLTSDKATVRKDWLEKEKAELVCSAFKLVGNP